MPYSWKAIGFGAVTVIGVMIAGQFIIDIMQIEVSTIMLGGAAGMVGAYVLMQINDKDKK